MQPPLPFRNCLTHPLLLCATQAASSHATLHTSRSDSYTTTVPTAPSASYTQPACHQQQQQQARQQQQQQSPTLKMPKLAGQNRKKIKDSSRDAAAAVKPKRGKPKSRSQGTSQKQLSAAQLFERAQQAIAFERYDAALECFKDALELEPENLDIIDARGALLAELGREAEAIQVCVCVWLVGARGSQWHAKGMQVVAQQQQSVAACRRWGGGQHMQLCMWAVWQELTAGSLINFVCNRSCSVRCSCPLMLVLRSTCTWGSCWRGRRLWRQHSGGWSCCSM